MHNSKIQKENNTYIQKGGLKMAKLSRFLELFPNKVCKYSDWDFRLEGDIPSKLTVVENTQKNRAGMPNFVLDFIENNKKVKKILYYNDTQNKRKRKNKKAEFMDLTPMQIDFLVNMVNDENWMGIDDTKLNMAEYTDFLESYDIMNSMQAGMMLTVLRNKNMITSEKCSSIWGTTVLFELTEKAKSIYEEVLEYTILNNRIELFDDSMSAKDLI